MTRANHPRPDSSTRPGLEPLEGRRLLSAMPRITQAVSYKQGAYTVSVAGPGEVRVRSAGKGLYNIELTGTTSASAVSIARNGTNSGFNGSMLPVAAIVARSGQIGQILGQGTVDLRGTITTSGPVQSIQLGQVGPAAKIDAAGGLGSLSTSGAIHLGPRGRIHVAGSLPGGLNAGSIQLDGGQITIDHDLDSLVSGPLSATRGGQFVVGHDLGSARFNGDVILGGGGSGFSVQEDSGGLTFNRNLTLAPGGRIAIGRDVTDPVTVHGNVSLDAAQFYLGRDVAGAITVDGNLAATHGGNLAVGRDVPGGLVVRGNIGLALGGFLLVGRDAGAAAAADQNSIPTGIGVGGNLSTQGGGSIIVGGNLNALQVVGLIVGQGTPAVDLAVGLDLNNWSVLGGVAGLGSVSGFNVDVAKTIRGLDIRHGLFNDYVTAGVAIRNGAIGPDGPVALSDTEIRAGVQIVGLDLQGDVRSDRPAALPGRRTRILAGVDRAGIYEVGGLIAGLTIRGSLIDSVVAASVQPFGGNGSVVQTPAPAPIDGNPGVFNAPGGGSIDGGPGYFAPAFDRSVNPDPVDRVLAGGSIGAGVAGTVLTTSHAVGADEAGFFAADTRAVTVAIPRRAGG